MQKSFTLEELRTFLTGKLGKHELPAAVDFVDELPRTPVGKLSRHELRQQQDRRQPHSRTKQQREVDPKSPLSSRRSPGRRNKTE